MSNAITGYLAANRDSTPEWQLLAGFECGGYAKLPLYLSEFILDFYEKTGIPLDAVYTAKLMRAVLELAKQGYWCPGTQVVAIHSGGLQGNRGFKQLELFRI